ncbi:MAG: hypothetical protein M1812_004076 [Candelaria pacifica]|nr:MAG: hypothetical protein M1812_004076 [Candelaria pacifica]
MTEAQPPPSESSPATPVDATPSPPKPPSSKPPSQRISPSLLSLTDSKISRLNRILSTTSGLDTTLLTLSYTLTLLTSTLPSLTNLQIPSLLTTTKSHIQPIPTSTRFTRTISSLRTLVTLISDIRIFLRLWGLLAIWSWGFSNYKNPPRDQVLKIIAWLQIGANAVFQGLENGAYLSSHGIVDLGGGGKGGKREGKWWLWSARFWAAHVALEFGRLGRVLVLKGREEEEERKRRSEWVGESVEKVGSVAKLEEGRGGVVKRREVERWWREFGVNLAYAPLVVHWSLEKGCVGDGWVGALGGVAGVLGFREAWRQTA